MLKSDYDVQRILYNPMQTPARATPEAAQAQTAEDAAQEQGSEIPEPAAAHGAGHDDAGLPDILDQLMADGPAPDASPAQADDAALNTTAPSTGAGLTSAS